jgi:hypothetical protein
MKREREGRGEWHDGTAKAPDTSAGRKIKNRGSKGDRKIKGW